MRDSRLRSIGVFAAVVAAILVIDQITKIAVRSTFSVGESTPLIPGLFNLVYVQNQGAAFGVFQGAKAYFILSAAVVCVIILIYLFKTPRHSLFELVTLGLIASGAVGNVIDRIQFGYVTDFIATAFIDFPVFNVADMAITCGCILFVFAFVFLYRPTEEEIAAEKSAAIDKDRSDD